MTAQILPEENSKELLRRVATATAALRVGDVVRIGQGPAFYAAETLDLLPDNLAHLQQSFAQGAGVDAEHPVKLLKLAGLLPVALAAGANAPIMVTLDPRDLDGYHAALAECLKPMHEARLPIKQSADARVVLFRIPYAQQEHLAILIGKPEIEENPLVRVHSSCLTGDVLGSLRCDCGEQLDGALTRMAEEGNGVLVYLNQEGRGIGLANKLMAYGLQDAGMDTVEANEALGFNADERDFSLAASILQQLGLSSVRLLTNNPQKVATLEECGVKVSKREPLVIVSNPHNEAYLKTKERRCGHIL